MKHQKFFVEFQYYIYAGILGFIALLLHDLLSQPKLDLLQTLSLICFAIALPFLVLSTLMVYNKKYHSPDLNNHGIKKWEKYETFVIYASIGPSCIGTIVLFIHSNLLAAISFCISLCIVMYIYEKVSDGK